MTTLAAVSGVLLTAVEVGGQEVPTVPQSDESAVLEAYRLLSSVDARLAMVGSVHVGPLQLERLRLLYFLSVDQEDYVDLAEEQTRRMRLGAEAPESVLQAFEAALEVVRGKHAFWPHHKVGHVRTGLGELDRIVGEDPDQIEVRYLRLMSCFFLPFFFGRSDTADADLEALGQLLPVGPGTLSPRAFEAVGEFVMKNGALGHHGREALQGALEEAASRPPPAQNNPTLRSPSGVEFRP